MKFTGESDSTSLSNLKLKKKSIDQTKNLNSKSNYNYNVNTFSDNSDQVNSSFKMVNLNNVQQMNNFSPSNQAYSNNRNKRRLIDMLKKNSSLYLTKYHIYVLFLLIMLTITSTFIITKTTFDKNYFYKIVNCENKSLLLNSTDQSQSEPFYYDLDYNNNETYNESVRLPTDLIPIVYNLKLQPFMLTNQFYFLGNLTVLVNCVNSTDIIKLNANQLLIDKSSILVHDNLTSYSINNINQHDEFLEIKLNNVLPVNQDYYIKINFKGNLSDNLSGFYRSTYTDSTTNQKKYMAMTQFQSTDARKAFPCWDEPSFKAKFRIIIRHYKNMTAISNMPVSSETEIDENWIDTVFYPTLTMSTYLLAFAVGDLRYLEDNSHRYKIWSRPSVVHTTEKALKYGPKILKHFENYFNIAYPLPKIDMLASPDFQAGAMENWGLITYRETYLLYDKRVSSLTHLYQICSVISHELAHQWFGNLVTPKWWDDLWLNEGFATFMSYEGVNSVHPEWNVSDKFITDEVQVVFNLDSLKTSHPISVHVNHPNEINEIFDHISYSKGAFIIRMIKYILGKETFKKGITSYLETYKYKNTDQNDLWNSLSEANKNSTNEYFDIRKIMNSWTLKEGYPFVIIKRGTGNQSNIIELQQRRFLQNKDLHDTNDTKFKWEIPLTYTTSKELNWDPKTRLWLHETDSSDKPVVYTINQTLTDNDWIIFNLQIVGCYRVTYDLNNWKLLFNQLLEDHEKIHRANRAQLIDDSMDLVEIGYLDLELALEACTYLKKETEYLPWTSVADTFKLIDQMLQRTEIYGRWQAYVRSLVQNLFNKYEFRNISSSTFQENELQRSAAHLACYNNDIKCIQSAVQLFKEYMNNVEKLNGSFNSSQIQNNIPPNVRQIVYCTGIENGDEKHWNLAWKLYLNEESATEKNYLLYALTCTRIPWLINRYLKMMFDDKSGLKQQDVVYIFKNIAASNYGQDIAFYFLSENFKKIYKIQGESISFSYVIKSFEGLNTKYGLLKIKNLYKEVKNKVGSAKRAFFQTMEQIEANMKWIQKHYESIQKFLDQKNF